MRMSSPFPYLPNCVHRLLIIFLGTATTSLIVNTTIRKEHCFAVMDFLAETWYDPVENEITKVELIGLEKALKFYWNSMQIAEIIRTGNQ